MAKRLFDFCLAGAALIVFLPLMVMIAIILTLYLKGNPIFSQIRPGRNEVLFNLYKFRTMTNKRGLDGELLDDEHRVTRLGSFLRSTSLDELPSLLNVLKGDLSLVGPRPLLVEYLDLYSQDQKIRHKVRPGITGWAQVNGRNAISWRKRLDLDRWYVLNQSMSLDIKIIILTIMKVVARKDISSDSHVTMEKFRGNNER